MQLNRMNRTVISLSCSFAMLAATSAVLAQDPAQASDSDKHFVGEALMGGMAEVELGQVASQKGTSTDVKQFGQKMVEDHTRMGAQMKEVASQIGVPVPTELSPEDQALKTRLQGLSGAQFDSAYIRAMVQDHQKDLETFQNEAANGTSQAVKDAASRGAKVVAEHLSMIQQIASAHHVTADSEPAAGKSGR